MVMLKVILIAIIGFNRQLIGELNWPMIIMMWVAKGWLCHARNRGQRVGSGRLPRAIDPIYGVGFDSGILWIEF